MSALDDQIRRLMAQRACLDHAADWVEEIDGPIVVIGYGDGTAYHHITSLLPKREIVVFDRGPEADLSRLPRDRVTLGDPVATLPQAWDSMSRSAALAHLSFAVTDTPRRASELAPLLAPLMAPGGIVVSEKPLAVPGWTDLPLPANMSAGRHYLYRAE
jgi:S-adenosyl-L-methionine methyltransferase